MGADAGAAQEIREPGKTTAQNLTAAARKVAGRPYLPLSKAARPNVENMQKLLYLLLALATFACQPSAAPDSESAPADAPTQTTTTEDDGWIVLFDGSSTAGWRGYNGKTLPPGWVVSNGELTFDDGAKTSDAEYEGGKDIIYAAEEFDNFELYLEWKIPPGGNSGIFYHLKEGYGSPPEVAPEYQLIDDEGYTQYHDITDYNKSLGYTDNPNEIKPLQSTAADYAMYAPDAAVKVLHPAGEWNSSRIIFTPEKVEYWLNEQKVVSFEPWSADWEAKKNSGKSGLAPDYGKFKSGYIGLQDHDSPLWFRNIKIKRL